VYLCAQQFKSQGYKRIVSENATRCMNQELAMLNATEKLFLLVAVTSLAGCGGLFPIFKSENAKAPVASATLTVAPSEGFVMLSSERVVSEPVISEPSTPDESVIYSRPLAAESPIPEPTVLP
jgi:hypothetical protein